MNSLAYQKRGRRTLLVLMAIRLLPDFFFLFCIFILVNLKDPILNSFKAAGTAAGPLTQVFTFLIGSSMLIFLLAFFVLILVAWLQYISFEYALDKAAFKTRRGIFNLDESSIPYRQIQNIDISRPLSYRLLGVSKLIILTAAHEELDVPEHTDSESVIDLLDAKVAAELQTELLNRSSLQAARILHPVHPTDVHKY